MAQAPYGFSWLSDRLMKPKRVGAAHLSRYTFKLWLGERVLEAVSRPDRKKKKKKTNKKKTKQKNTGERPTLRLFWL